MCNCILCGKSMNNDEYMLNFHTCDDCTKGKHTTVEDRLKELQIDKE